MTNECVKMQSFSCYTLQTKVKYPSCAPAQQNTQRKKANKIWLIQNKPVPLHSLSWIQSFYLKRKLIPIWRFGAVACEGCRFFIFYYYKHLTHYPIHHLTHRDIHHPLHHPYITLASSLHHPYIIPTSSLHHAQSHKYEPAWWPHMYQTSIESTYI